MKKDLSFNYKRKLYFSVYLPIMLYEYEIWSNILLKKSTYVDKLARIQRKFLIASTGCYRTVNNEKLLNLTNINRIDKEIEIIKLTKMYQKNERKQILKTERENRIKVLGSYKCNGEVNEIRSRFSFWCITETGPFKYYLYKIKKSEDIFCRFCGFGVETAEHLLFECRSINILLNNTFTTKQLDECSKILIEKLNRFLI